jgi:hypothetical protein
LEHLLGGGDRDPDCLARAREMSVMGRTWDCDEKRRRML